MCGRLCASDVIRRLNLQPLPGEGGYFRETYRSPTTAGSGLSKGSGDRALATSIYYLLTADTFSALHRLASDEVYYFHAGDPVELYQITGDGTMTRTVLGTRLEQGDACQAVVAAGTWQGSQLVECGEWALLGTTVSPGFEFADCELASEAVASRWSEEVRLAATGLIASSP